MRPSPPASDSEWFVSEATIPRCPEPVRGSPAPIWRPMNELLIRSLAGFVLILLALGTAFLGGYSFAVFVALASVMIFYEWRRLVVGWGFAWKAAGFVYALLPALSLLWIRDRAPQGLPDHRDPRGPRRHPRSRARLGVRGGLPGPRPRDARGPARGDGRELREEGRTHHGDTEALRGRQEKGRTS